MGVGVGISMEMGMSIGLVSMGSRRGVSVQSDSAAEGILLAGSGSVEGIVVLVMMAIAHAIAAVSPVARFMVVVNVMVVVVVMGGPFDQAGGRLGSGGWDNARTMLRKERNLTTQRQGVVLSHQRRQGRSKDLDGGAPAEHRCLLPDDTRF